MADDEDVEEIVCDTYSAKSDAEDMLHQYAAMLAEAGLAHRYRVSVKPDYEVDQRKRKRYDRPPMWDIILTDHLPDQPQPGFLRSVDFHFKRKAHRQERPKSPAPASQEPDEDEADSVPTRRPRLPRGAMYEVNGETRTLRQWAEAAGVSYPTLIRRLQQGSSLEDALTRPKYQRRG